MTDLTRSQIERSMTWAQFCAHVGIPEESQEHRLKLKGRLYRCWPTRTGRINCKPASLFDVVKTGPGALKRAASAAAGAAVSLGANTTAQAAARAEQERQDAEGDPDSHYLGLDGPKSIFQQRINQLKAMTWPEVVSVIEHGYPREAWAKERAYEPLNAERYVSLEFEHRGNFYRASRQGRAKGKFSIRRIEAFTELEETNEA